MAPTFFLSPATARFVSAVPPALEDAGFRRAERPPTSLLIEPGTDDSDAIIARLHAFAAAAPPGNEALAVTLLHRPASPDDWATTRRNAVVWAFIRQAALAWAPRQLRLNAIGLGVTPRETAGAAAETERAAASIPSTAATPEDIARTVLALWRLRSMTGQIISLADR